MKIFIALFIAFSVISCATTEQYQVPEGFDPSKLTTLNFYRTNVAFHSLNPEKPFIYLNDKVVAKLGTGQNKVVKVPAGNYRLSVRQPIMFMPGHESDSFEYDFEAGKEYYIRYSMEFGGLRPAGKTIVPIGSSNFSLTNKENYVNRR